MKTKVSKADKLLMLVGAVKISLEKFKINSCIRAPLWVEIYNLSRLQCFLSLSLWKFILQAINEQPTLLPPSLHLIIPSSPRWDLVKFYNQSQTLNKTQLLSHFQPAGIDLLSKLSHHSTLYSLPILTGEKFSRYLSLHLSSMHKDEVVVKSKLGQFLAWDDIFMNM